MEKPLGMLPEESRYLSIHHIYAQSHVHKQKYIDILHKTCHMQGQIESDLNEIGQKQAVAVKI